MLEHRSREGWYDVKVLVGELRGTVVDCTPEKIRSMVLYPCDGQYRFDWYQEAEWPTSEGMVRLIPGAAEAEEHGLAADEAAAKEGAAQADANAIAPQPAQQEAPKRQLVLPPFSDLSCFERGHGSEIEPKEERAPSEKTEAGAHSEKKKRKKEKLKT